MGLCNPMASVCWLLLVREEKVEDAVDPKNAIDNTVEDEHCLHAGTAEARICEEADLNRRDESRKQEADRHHRVPVRNPWRRAWIDHSAAMVFELERYSTMQVAEIVAAPHTSFGSTVS